MPITVAKMAANTADVTVYDGDDSAAVIYYPGRVTEKIIASVLALDNVDEATVLATFKTFNEDLANLIQSWEVFEDVKQTIMFPIDASRFPELPFPFRMRVFQAISGDLRPESVAPRTPN